MRNTLHLSIEKLNTMTGSKLVKHYNTIACFLKIKEVNKFTNKRLAIRRCIKLQNQLPSAEDKTGKKVKAKKAKPPTSIKSLTISLIADGLEDKQIVDAVKKKFPESKFNFAHISWYRSTLFRDNIIGPEFAPRKGKAYKAWKVEQTKV